MELLEIRNNLVKLSYAASETPILGHFITLNSDEKSYVAQFVNLKSDMNGSFAIAKLLFTFTNDGIVDAYDGSVPSLSYKVNMLATSELLNLLPVQTALKMGSLSSLGEELFLDVSIFEHNFSVFTQHSFERATVVSNFVRQLFQLKQKSVVVDIDGSFGSFPKIRLGDDYKLPLNEKMLDFIFEHELSGVDDATRAVVQDIFYAVVQYIKTLDEGFLPIGKFIDVVAQQYKVLQMPELALLKNKLLKYRDANVFADTKEEVDALKAKLQERNAVIVDLKDLNGDLQKAIISYLHRILDTVEDYVCFFVPLEDDNSDKALIKSLINHKHVLSVILASHSYKYADEVKENSENVMFFAPQTVQHDFAAYNTFLNKLNSGECVVYGKLTLGVPFIVDVEDMELDLTCEDVLGEKSKFVPATPLEPLDESNPDITQKEEIEVVSEDEIADTIDQEPETVKKDTIKIISKGDTDSYDLNNITESSIVEADDEEEQVVQEEILPLEDFEQESVEDFDDKPIEGFDDEAEFENTGADMDSDDELDFMNLSQNDELSSLEPDGELDMSNQFVDIDEQIEEDEQMVPVYPIEEDDYEEAADEDSEYAKGDVVVHPRYGNGVVEKIIRYGNKTLCSIDFENVGRRLLDPAISEFSRA